jgi:ATP-dependent DNA ligase
MLLRERRDPFDGAYWLFEPKWDGWRCIAAVLESRA